MDLLSIFSVISLIILPIYLYLKWCNGYWKRRGIDYVEPALLFGNIKEWATRKISLGDQLLQVYKQLKAKHLKHGGGIFMFTQPFFVPLDVELIKNILQKDFNHFVNHGMYVNEEADPLTGHLFNLEDEKWRNLRVKLTPTFTSGKMKMMFQTLVDCSSGLIDRLNDHAVAGDPLDVKESVACFSTDIIGSCAFGLDCNSFKDPNSEFRKYGRKIFASNFFRTMKVVLISVAPKYILKALNVKATDKDVEKFFMKVVKDTVQYRENNNVNRKDFLNLLLQLKNGGNIDGENANEDDKQKNKDQMTMNELAAQCFVFFSAGFETSSTTMTFALLELALNQDIQEKLRKDINTVLERHDGKITYEAIMEMTYLDKVVNETLRKHPPVMGVPRVCNKTYTVPNSNIVFEPGMVVHISIIGIHHDPDYYPNPEVFDPERFSEENKAKRPACTFIPFGEGPRICIGLRFGLMQTKVGLTSILSKYKITVNKKTHLPIKYDPATVVSSVKDGVWLDVSKLD